MEQHKLPYRYLCLLMATLAFVLALPHQTLAEEAAALSEDDIFYQKSYLMLSTKQYKELDQRFHQVLDAYARNEITAEELSNKFDNFAKTPGLEPRYDEWVKAFPQSYSARLARGIYRAIDAWEKRGASLARNTTDSQLRGFREILIEAHSDLKLSLNLYARPVDSYRYLIRISKGLSMGDERDLLDAALKIDPKAYDPRFEYFDAIAPKWGGSEELMGEFFEECKQSSMSERNKKRIEGKYYYAGSNMKCNA
jgi:hypothetical protein